MHRIELASFDNFNLEQWKFTLKSGTWKAVIEYFKKKNLEYWRQTKNSTRMAILGEEDSLPAASIAPGFSYSRMSAYMMDELPVGRGVVMPDNAFSFLANSYADKKNIWLKFAKEFAYNFTFVDRNNGDLNNMIRYGPTETIDILIVINRILSKAFTTQRSRFFGLDVKIDKILNEAPVEPILMLIDGKIKDLIASGFLPSSQYDGIEDVNDIFCL